MNVLIPQDWRVPAVFIKRLGDSAGRQRAMADDGHLLLVLHEPPVQGIAERAARILWRDPKGAWKSKPLGSGVQALKQHVAEFAERVDKLDKRWQAAVSAADYFDLLRDIAPLHRAVRHLHATLQQARELVPDDRDLINLRDQGGRDRTRDRTASRRRQERFGLYRGASGRAASRADVRHGRGGAPPQYSGGRLLSGRHGERDLRNEPGAWSGRLANARFVLVALTFRDRERTNACQSHRAETARNRKAGCTAIR